MVGNNDGVNYGHIAIWDGKGGFYWEGDHNSTPHHLSYAEINEVLNGTKEINGSKLTDNYHGAKLIGWSDNLEGVQIITKK
ncbi:hypothetical protein ACJQWY_06490 [Weissella kandleri]|uniref:hypothetical protein n=1 Tax=Weissella kandleri TaxID=1616 RepID=UPI00387EB0C6